MNKSLIQIIVYLILSVNGFGQNKFIITIDEACFQSAETKLIDGTFGLYGDIQTSSYPFWQRDTLIEVLEFKPEQEIYLESRSYTLRFIPNDSTQKAHYEHIHPQNKAVNLSCFFFNKPVPLALKTMKNNDSLKLVSRYAGPTNMETIIPIYTLVMVKKRSHYFAAFRETSGNEQDLLMLNLAIGPHEQKRIKVRKNFIKLTEDQVMKIEAFWSTMAMYWYDQDHSSIPSLTSIHDQNGQLTFPSNEYVSCLLWNELK